MGAVLAFTLASGVGVQAKSPEELAKVTRVSQAEFETLRPAGEATLEQKREVIGDILLDAGVPEFMVEKMDGDMLESLYKCPGFEVQIEYSQEEPDGTLKRISSEQYGKIRSYNSKIRNNKLYNRNPIIRAQTNGVETGTSNGEINNLLLLLIVGAASPGQDRLCVALAGWEYPPLIRGRDFIGIYTGEPKVKYKTALATLAYTEQHLETATTTDHAIEYPYKGEDFLDDLHGVGRNIQLPADRTIPGTLPGESKSHVCTDIMLGIRTYAEVPVGGSVLANY